MSLTEIHEIHLWKNPVRGAVQLLPGPVFHRQQLNERYLLSLDPDRLLHQFRCVAGLSCHGAEPLGGWESPECGCRGHFVGHYLSACAKAYVQSRNTELQKQLNRVIDGLYECQRALGNGYLGAFPESELDIIETRFEGAWAPYYVIHKILTGLVDAHSLGNIKKALSMAVKLGDYVCERLKNLKPIQLQSVFRTDHVPNPPNEFGGMGEILQRLYDLTKDERYDVASRHFEPDWFVEPLSQGRDLLTGLHANTHIPIVLSLAKRYERTKDTRLREAVRYFWDFTALTRSFVNGGSTGPRPDRQEKSAGAEHWPEAYCLSRTLTSGNNESCVTHNMMRLTDILFRWSGDSKYVDFYERAYFNHVLGMQNYCEVGRYIYHHPLAAGSHKVFGSPLDSFWCCYGSTIEAYADLTRGIYYLRNNELRVNLFVSSVLNWVDKGVHVTQTVLFPGTPPRVEFKLHMSYPKEFCISLRLPSWAMDWVIEVDGNRLGLFLGEAMLFRRWQDGQRIVVYFKPRLFYEPMPDDAGLIAFRYGPHVLAALTSGELNLAAKTAEQALNDITVDENLVCHIRLSTGNIIQLVPLNQVVHEHFGVYHRLLPATTQEVQ